jgi:tRNA(adenine34) deaminase
MKSKNLDPVGEVKEYTSTDERCMLIALEAAREAEEQGEVPVGACVVNGDRLISVARNQTRGSCDPTAHAEMVALREAARAMGNYRLTEAAVYSTIEPCAMCTGALIQARVRRLIYGARDPRAGAVESHFQICNSKHLNHRIEVISGVLEAECSTLIQNFFRSKRVKQ